MYKIEKYTSTDDGPLVDLARLCFGETGQSEEYWSWRYRSEFRDNSVVFVALKGDVLVGMQPVAFFPAHFKGASATVGILTSVCVHPDHRGQGLFGKLVNECEFESWRRGALLLATMPNDKSYPLFHRRNWMDPGLRTLMAFTALSPANLFRLLSQPANARTKGSGQDAGASIVEVTKVDAEWDSFADQQARKWPGVWIRRDAKWVNWRYLTCPSRSYDVLQYRGKNTQLEGWLACVYQKTNRVKTGFILDLHANSDQVAVRLLRVATRNLTRKGCVAIVAVESDISALSRLRQSGFRKVPERLSPKRFFTVYRANPDLAKDVQELSKIGAWRFSLGDWDNI